MTRVAIVRRTGVRRCILPWGVAVTILACLPTMAAARARVLDAFDDTSRWEALASEGATIRISSGAGRSDNGLRIDFDFNATGGYVNAKSRIKLHLPDNYRFTFALRGNGPPNNLELKLIDATGRNVWWRNQRSLPLSTEWQEQQVWRDQIEFAWGPNPGVAVDIEFLELTIKASSGGKGTVWVDDLTFEPIPTAASLPWPPLVRSSTSSGPLEAAAMFDGDAASVWHSDATQLTLTIDLFATRLIGGLVIDWDAQDFASSYAISVAETPDVWHERFATTDGDGGRDYIYLPDCAARWLKIELRAAPAQRGYGIRELSLKPYSFSATPNELFTALAADDRPGAYPRYFLAQQTYWTVVGQSGDAHEALLNEDGALEIDAQSFTIEPFLYDQGSALTWSDVSTTHELLQGYLPIPSVTWQSPALRLNVTAVATGDAGASTLYARYRVTNTGADERTVKLYLALRPFQVNPLWQSLNAMGGATTIWGIDRDGASLQVREREQDAPRHVELLTPPTRFGAARFEQGSMLDFIRRGTVPSRESAQGSFGWTSGLIEYERRLAPGATAEIAVAVPWSETSRVGRDVDSELERARNEWQQTLGRVGLQVDCQPELADLWRSTLAYILINRDGAALQPGSRTYARSWIRDGALTSTALLQMGLIDEVRDYLAWYASHQFDSGRVPCCVDRRGADPTPEYDSDGELIYALAEYFRYTQDISLVRVLWPRVTAAVDHLSVLRQERMSDRYREGKERIFYGLLPESISHEGYAAQPVHSFWDDFFALRGFLDAAALARALGDGERAQQYAELAKSFESDVVASLRETAARNGIDYIAGSVELADFDPTATSILPTIGLRLPQLDALFRSTFARYHDIVTARAQGRSAWTNYAPYEFRNLAAFVALGERDWAAELLSFLVDYRRPQGWNLWPEIIWHDPDLPRFIGDMPHTWVGAGFISGLRSMLLQEDSAADRLVLAPGVPASWLENRCRVQVADLPTSLGKVSYTMQRESDARLTMQVLGSLRSSTTRVIVRPPLSRTATAVTINGERLSTFDGRDVILEKLPADIVFESISDQ